VADARVDALGEMAGGDEDLLIRSAAAARSNSGIGLIRSSTSVGPASSAVGFSGALGSFSFARVAADSASFVFDET
jgi:hypothetical protein